MISRRVRTAFSFVPFKYYLHMRWQYSLQRILLVVRGGLRISWSCSLISYGCRKVLATRDKPRAKIILWAGEVFLWITCDIGALRLCFLACYLLDSHFVIAGSLQCRQYPRNHYHYRTLTTLCCISLSKDKLYFDCISTLFNKYKRHNFTCQSWKWVLRRKLSMASGFKAQICLLSVCEVSRRLLKPIMEFTCRYVVLTYLSSQHIPPRLSAQFLHPPLDLVADILPFLAALCWNCCPQGERPCRDWMGVPRWHVFNWLCRS